MTFDSISSSPYAFILESSDTTVPVYTLDGLLGATFVGLLFSILLFGVACVQTFIYIRECRTDRLLFKITVAAVVILDMVQLGTLSYTQYNWLVTNYGNLAASVQSSATSIIQVVLAALTDFIVRSFFARRVYILCREKMRPIGVAIAAGVILVSAIAFALTCTYTIRINQINTEPPTPERVLKQVKISWMLYTFYAGGTAADIAVAASLSILLNNSRTGFKRTDDLVTFWMMFSMNSGLLTSVVALTALIVYTAHPTILASLGISFVLCQLHVNSLLVSLNARGSLRQRGSNDPSSSNELSHSNHNHLSINAGNTHVNSFAIPLSQTRLAIAKEVTTFNDSAKHADF